MAVPKALADLGITQDDIDQAMVDDGVDEQLNNTANKMAEYWRSLAPVGTADEGDENPGAYRDSIHVERAETFDGFVVQADDFKSHWIEFGSRHMPEYAPAAKTAAAFGGVGPDLPENVAPVHRGLQEAIAEHEALKKSRFRKNPAERASKAQIAAAKAKVERLREARSTAFRTARQKRYRNRNAAAIKARRAARRNK
jgi:hypothetical protein